MKTATIVEQDGRVGTLFSTRDSQATVGWTDGSTSHAALASLETIGEIDYRGVPHEQVCCHASCRKPLAVWWNVRNEKWYCHECAQILNSGGKIVCYMIDG